MDTRVPQRPLELARNRHFEHRIEPESGSYPSGMTAEIQIRDSTDTVLLDTWVGTVTPTAVTWLVDPEIADAIPGGSRYTLAVLMPTAPPTWRDWFVGIFYRRYRWQ
ncbi:LtfC-like domain-containing protein [Nocardia aurea]|uniref:LtfC-like domain-containing protein n=1 Tax=Nocardia aurea TaxID=2144174 RepID=UPI0033B98571